MADKRIVQPGVAGHRCKGAFTGFQVRCECGWQSAVWFTEGARSNAYGEWRRHIEMCRPQEEKAA